MKILTTMMFLTAMCLSSSASAQVIDVFDDQDKMKTTKIEVGDASGALQFERGSDGQTGSGISIKFERKDSSIMVPAKIRGKTVYFLFDTGATYTTLSGGFAKSVGLSPKKDYPIAMMQTANGSRPAQFGLIDRLMFGGRSHSGVSFTVCDACPTGIYKGKPVVGLLGLNVVGRYKYSIDEGAGTIEMYPHSDYSNRLRDVRPWLESAGNRAEPTDLSEFKYKFSFKNKAPRTIEEMKVTVSCSNGKEHTLKRTSIGPSKKVTFSKKFKRGECPGARYDVASARW